MIGSIASTTENSHAIDEEFQTDRNTDFAAAKNRDHFNRDLISLKIGLRQVDLEAAKNRDDFSTHEILRDNAAAPAPENIDIVEPRFRGIAPIGIGLPMRLTRLPRGLALLPLLVEAIHTRIEPFHATLHALVEPLLPSGVALPLRWIPPPPVLIPARRGIRLRRNLLTRTRH